MKCVRDINNWLYIKRTIKREIQNPKSNWHLYKLRTNWYGRIYTVLSITEEDMGEEELVRNWKAIQLMKPINEYLSSLDFTEIVYPSIEYIPGSRSYLIVYTPLFRKFTVGYVFKFFLFLILIIFIIILSYKFIYGS